MKVQLLNKKKKTSLHLYWSWNISKASSKQSVCTKQIVGWMYYRRTKELGWMLQNHVCIFVRSRADVLPRPIQSTAFSQDFQEHLCEIISAVPVDVRLVGKRAPYVLPASGRADSAGRPDPGGCLKRRPGCPHTLSERILGWKRLFPFGSTASWCNWFPSAFGSAGARRVSRPAAVVAQRDPRSRRSDAMPRGD